MGLIGKNKLSKKENIILAICVVIIMIFRLWNISELNGPIIFDDEAGYWGHAANLAGLPWNSVEGAWYSYGYSLLLTFLFHISHNMTVLYKLAVVLNAGLGIISLLLGICIIDELEIECDNINKILFSFLAVMYSAYIFQAQIAWSETFLYTWFLLVMLLGVRFCKKPDIRNTILFSAAVFFLYIIHNRSIVMFVAYALLLGYMFVQKKINYRMLLKAGCVMLVMFCLNDYAKDYVTLMMHGQDGIGFVGNNVTSHAGKAVILSTLSGWWRFFLSIIGKVWYLLTATFLLAFSGLAFIIRKFLEAIKNKDESGLKYFYFFIGLCFMGMLAVASISTVPKTVDYSTETRLDIFFYGRYTEAISGILIICGLLNLLELMRSRKLILESIIFVCIYLICTVLLYCQIKDITLYYVNTACVPGIWNSSDFKPLICAAIAIVIYIIGVIIYSTKSLRFVKTASVMWMGILIPLSFVWIGQKAYLDGIAPAQANNARYEEIYNILNEYIEFPVYYAESDYAYGQSIRTRVVEGIFKYASPDNYSDDFFLVADDAGLDEVMLKGTYYCLSHIDSQYLLVKGDKIMEALIDAGYKLDEFIY